MPDAEASAPTFSSKQGAMPLHQGAIERIDRMGLAGWCFLVETPDTPVSLAVEVNGFRATYIRTKLPRPDLSSGRTSPLRAGFELAWVQVEQGCLVALLQNLGEVADDSRVDFQVVREDSGEALSQDWLKQNHSPPVTAGELRDVLSRLAEPLDGLLHQSQAVVLTGMHRSGTSAMAAALNRLGLWMGNPKEFWPPADRWNPNGYFELSWVVKLNDHLLEQTGHRWDHPPLDDLAWQGNPGLVQQLLRSARGVCKELQSQAVQQPCPVWGFKDPRTMVVWQLWDQVLPKALWVLSIRHPLEVAQSLVRRDGAKLEDALRLVQIYFEHLAQLVAQHPNRCMVVCYSNFLTLPRQLLGPLSRWAGLAADARAVREAAQAISSEYQHHGLADLSWPAGFDALRHIYLDLRQASLFPGSMAASRTSTDAMSKTNSSLYALDQAPTHRGGAETLCLPSISGWCFQASQPSQPVELSLVCEGVALGTTWTARERADLSAGLGEPCSPGFVFHWSEASPSVRALLMETLAADPSRMGDRVLVRIFVSNELELDTAWALKHDTPTSRQALLAHLKGLADESRHDSLPARREAMLKELQPVQAPPDRARMDALAFYLPQFHPTPENNEWWGKGFTEWTQVTRGTPRFAGHDQPRHPSELGFYDLRTPGVMAEQIALAQAHGLRGFCFHHYWLDGKRLLDAPLKQFLALPHEFGFCLNWANEPWSRRWDGGEQEVLMPQTHQLESDIAFFNDVLPLLRDRRYLRVEGKPLLLVYRVSLLSDARQVIDRWRAMALAAGLPGLHVAMVESFGLNDPREWGCDSSVQFPPHNQRDLVEKPQAELSPGFRGKVFQYPQIVANALNQAAVPHRRYPGAMLAWDNTARRGDDAHIYANYEPGAFELWLEHCAQQVRAQCPEGERYVFINAWNEWSEGSYLEPDHRWGRAALEAVRAVVTGQAGPQTHLALLRHRLADDAESLHALEALASRFVGLKQSLDYSLFLSRSRHPQHLPSRVFDRPPPGLNGTRTAGSGHIERMGHSRVTAFAQAAQGSVLTLSGWGLPDDRNLHEGSLSFVLLRPELTSGPADSAQQGAVWYAWVNQRHRRPDVHTSSGQSEARSLWSGWSAEVMLAGVPPGRYGLSLAFPCESLGSSEPATEIPLRSCLEVLP